MNAFSVNVETGYGTFDGVYDASPLRVAQFKDIWEGNQYGPVIALTYCAYQDDTVVPVVSAYSALSEDYWEKYWPAFTVQYSWAGEAPADLAAPVDDAAYTYEQYLAGGHLTTPYVSGYSHDGTRAGVAGTWTFNDWEFNGWIRGEAIMDYVGSWSFTASDPTPVPDPVPDTPITPVTPVTPSKPTEPSKPSTPVLPFVDAAEGEWYYNAVKYVYENGLMNGVGDGTHFDSDGSVTRAMAVQTLYRMAGSPAVSGTNGFTDLTGDWYRDAVQWAYVDGITTGRTETTFAPDEHVTREELAAFFYRYAVLCGCDVSATADLSGYVDVDELGAWAEPAMRWANGAGLIFGRGADALAPRGNAARSELATILMRFCQTFAN